MTFAKTVLVLLVVCFIFNSSLYASKVDYVIVGVGTAGALLAKQLSDDKKTTVVALHNGPNLSNDPLIKFSDNAIVTVGSGLIGPPLFLSADSTPQPNANDQTLQWIMPVPLGGGSSINAGAYCRGTNQVYSQWEAIAGPLWSVKRILNIYQALETYTGLTTNPAVRGFKGPLSVRQIPFPSQVSIKFAQAIMSGTGVPFVLDYNDPNTPIGTSTQLQYTQMGVAGELRASSAITFLNSKVMTPNGRGAGFRKLRVFFNSIALRIIWEGNKAIGVEYFSSGKVRSIYASKGIILTAGLYSSSLLLHSGVGPRNLLQSLGIPVIFDNPNVGQGLADQPRVTLIFLSNPNDTEFPIRENFLSLFDNSSLQSTPIGQYLIEAFNSFTNTNASSQPNPFNNRLMNRLDHGLFGEIAWLPAPGGNPTIRELRFSTITPIPGITIVAFDLVQPKSRGTITIDNANPFAAPIVNLGVFTNPADLVLFQNGLQIYVKAINEALQAIDPLYELVIPDPLILDDLDLLTEFIKDTVGSNMHFQSHCRMAPFNQGGVVDSTGHVYGVQNLIVADDSIAPVNMDGSPMASAYLIAANIANILLH